MRSVLVNWQVSGLIFVICGNNAAERAMRPIATGRRNWT